MADRARETYTDEWTDEVLVAAAKVSDRALELTPRLSPQLEAAFKGLAEAVYQWTEQLDLLDELEGEGVRAGSVADAEEVRTGLTYSASVERVLAAAEALCHRVLLEEELVVPAISLSDHASPPSRELLHDLENAFRWWERRADVAAEQWEEGMRPALVRSAASAPPPTPDPPQLPPTGGLPRRSGAEGIEDSDRGASPRAERDHGGGDSAALWRLQETEKLLDAVGEGLFWGAGPPSCDHGIGPLQPLGDDDDDEATRIAEEEVEGVTEPGLHVG
jgi:hypothetical protein